MRWDIEKKKAEFLEIAKSIHGEKYDYETYSFLGMTKKMKIGCKIHGFFEQQPKQHIRQKQGCPKCGIEKRSKASCLGKEVFIDRARKIFGDRYNYDEVVYKTGDDLIRIKCSKHGVFKMRPDLHAGQKQGCPKCGRESGTKKRTYSLDQFIEEAKNTHGHLYDYSLVEYNNSREKINIICKKHGEFKQTAVSHVSGRGCPKCCEDGRGLSLIIPFSEFVERSNLVHNNQYTYDESCYTMLKSKTKIRIVCPKHGDFFRQPQLHLRGDGCPYCADGTRGFRRTRFIERCRHYGRPPSVYLVRITGDNEDFIKIGVTSRDVKTRFHSRCGYKYSEILIITGEPDMIWTLEKDLHAMFRNKIKYTPLTKFPGSGECYDKQSLEEIMNKMIELAQEREGFSVFSTPNLSPCSGKLEDWAKNLDLKS